MNRTDGADVILLMGAVTMLIGAVFIDFTILGLSVALFCVGFVVAPPYPTLEELLDLEKPLPYEKDQDGDQNG